MEILAFAEANDSWEKSTFKLLKSNEGPVAAWDTRSIPPWANAWVSQLTLSGVSYVQMIEPHLLDTLAFAVWFSGLVRSLYHNRGREPSA